MAGRIIVDIGKYGVSEAFVERAGLEAEGVEEDTGIAAGAGDLLRLAHEPGADAGAEEVVGEHEEFEEHQAVDRLGPEATDDGAGAWIADDEAEPAFAAGAGEGEVVGGDAVDERGAVG